MLSMWNIPCPSIYVVVACGGVCHWERYSFLMAWAPHLSFWVIVLVLVIIVFVFRWLDRVLLWLVCTTCVLVEGRFLLGGVGLAIVGWLVAGLLWLVSRQLWILSLNSCGDKMCCVVGFWSWVILVMPYMCSLLRYSVVFFFRSWEEWILWWYFPCSFYWICWMGILCG